MPNIFPHPFHAFHWFHRKTLDFTEVFWDTSDTVILWELSPKAEQEQGEPTRKLNHLLVTGWVQDVFHEQYQPINVSNDSWITSWWLNHPSEKYSSNWIISPNRAENKKYLKPPPRNVSSLKAVLMVRFPDPSPMRWGRTCPSIVNQDTLQRW